MSDRVEMRDLSAEHFEPLVGEQFHLADRVLELVEVERYPRATLPRARRTNFSLLFRQAEGEPLMSGQYRVRHARIESADALRIERIAPPARFIEPAVYADQPFYEIAFN